MPLDDMFLFRRFDQPLSSLLNSSRRDNIGKIEEGKEILPVHVPLLSESCNSGIEGRTRRRGRNWSSHRGEV